MWYPPLSHVRLTLGSHVSSHIRISLPNMANVNTWGAKIGTQPSRVIKANLIDSVGSSVSQGNGRWQLYQPALDRPKQIFISVLEMESRRMEQSSIRKPWFLLPQASCETPLVQVSCRLYVAALASPLLNLT